MTLNYDWKERLGFDPDHEYLLSFVGMGVVNPDYSEYVGGGGRLEIDDVTEESPYSDLEVGYLTEDRGGLNKFRDQYYFEVVSGDELEYVVEYLINNFRDGYDD